MPRAWLAIFFGYEGKNFSGMQFQKDENIQTVEGEIIRVLKQRQFVLSQNSLTLVKDYKWSRAARTDKGVHALINGVSAWFYVPAHVYDEDHVLNKDKLDLQFREMFEGSEIFYHCFKRVTPRFEMRQLIKTRLYTYICPIQLFPSKLSKTETLQKIQKCCEKFIGTHNFHNYSKGIKAKDPRAMRYVLTFRCSQLTQGMIKFQIRGQSFIYHQIRKIIGSIVFVFLNEWQPEFLDNTFFKNQLSLPLAPPQGLYLEGISFDSYNKKKQIPEQIVLQDQKIASIIELRKVLQKNIIEHDPKEWEQWLQHLKNGSLFKLEESEPQVQDG